MKIKDTITKTFGKIKFGAIKYSPEILVVAGVVGVVASAVIACKATTKLDDILEQTKTDVDKIHECVDRTDLAAPYTEEDSKKDLVIVYVQTGVKLVKLYAPAVILGALSITSIIGSHYILKKRNVALAAAYATVDKGFKEYRKRVAEKIGDEAEKELRYGIKAKTIEETVTDEDGREIKVEKNVTETSLLPSPYARIYDELNPNWERDSDYNLMYIRNVENKFNDKLKAYGYVFLNDVYEALGFPKTKTGQVVGWVYDPDNPEHEGDNYIDFGLYSLNRQNANDFVNGYEYSVILDFNVDGNIMNKIREEDFYA